MTTDTETLRKLVEQATALLNINASGSGYPRVPNVAVSILEGFVAALTPSLEAQAEPYAWLLNVTGRAFYERPNEHSINLYTPVYTNPPAPQPEAPAAQDQLEVGGLLACALRAQISDDPNVSFATKRMQAYGALDAWEDAIALAALSAAGRKEGV